MKSTITRQQQKEIRSLVESMELSRGIGTSKSACSIAAINLALTGKLTDAIPACMSLAIGRWIVEVQDAMPAEIRNSHKWKRLLPLAAGTGRELEQERLQILLDWMWDVVLPSLQALADANGFGFAWSVMCEQKTSDTAHAAHVAAVRAGCSSAAASAGWAETAICTTASASAACAAAAETAAAVRAAAWQEFDPCKVLKQLIQVGGKR